MSKYDEAYRAYDDEWDRRNLKWYGHFTMHPWWTALGIIAALVAISLILNIVGTLSLYWNAEQAKLSAPAREQQAIYSDPQSIISSNGYFHQQCRTIIADVQNLKSSKEADKQTLKRKPSDSIAQIQWQSDMDAADSAVMKYEQQIVNDAQDYNAKAASYATKPFRDANLPQRIETNSNGMPKSNLNCH
jgi:hypothetical protein